jgi:diguanylate cyclase (GGDEF)-like protein
MDFSTLLERRREPAGPFLIDPIDPAILDRIVAAGDALPFPECGRVRVVTLARRQDQEDLMRLLGKAGLPQEQVARLQGAAVLLALTRPPGNSRGDPARWVAAAQMMIAAEDIGIGAVLLETAGECRTPPGLDGNPDDRVDAVLALGYRERPAPGSDHNPGDGRDLLGSLLEIASATAGADDLDRLLATIAREMGRLFAVDAAAASFLDGEAMICSEVVQRPGALHRDADRLPIDASHHMGWVVTQARALWRNDIASELRFKESLPRAGMHSDMTIPLRARGQVSGAFRVASRQRHAYDPEDFEILKRLADIMSVAVENQRLLQATRKMAEVDGLTGISNRRHFQETLAREVERARETARPLALLLFDVDHFKRFNDTWGHPAGDAVLRHVAQTAARLLRRSDLVARYGGEEFVALLPGADGPAAAKVAENIRAEVEKAPLPLGRPLPPGGVTISLGVAAFPRDAPHVAGLIGAADQALYRAKRSGRNRVEQAGEAGDSEAPA